MRHVSLLVILYWLAMVVALEMIESVNGGQSECLFMS